MSEPILLISGKYHLGDNPGVFQDATYIGTTMSVAGYKNMDRR